MNILHYILIAIIFTAEFSFAQAADIATKKDEIHDCMAGLEKCHEYKEHDEEFQQCMKYVCTGNKEYIKSLEQTKRPAICDLGLIKCDSIREYLVPYWSCMKDTCGNPNAEKAPELPDCKQEAKQCTPYKNNYMMCVALTCGTRPGQKAICPEAEKECTPAIDAYHKCIRRKCYGDMTKYIKQHVIEKGYKEEIKSLNLDDANLIIPLNRRIVGSVTKHFKCQSFKASISCKYIDIETCYCSDGSDLLPRKPRKITHEPDSEITKEQSNQSKELIKKFFDWSY